jgi:aminoglycoside/choline kinase family phosphotransferase
LENEAPKQNLLETNHQLQTHKLELTIIHHTLEKHDKELIIIKGQLIKAWFYNKKLSIQVVQAKQVAIYISIATLCCPHLKGFARATTHSEVTKYVILFVQIFQQHQ